MKRKYSIVLLIFVILIFTYFYNFKSNDINVTKPLIEVQGERNINDSIAETDFSPLKSSNQIVKHEYYSLSYNENFEQADWVFYKLEKNSVVHSDFKRPYFTEDPLVLTKSADWKNYKNSGYDKGHLCPAGDMKFSKKAYEETFYTSNISPQKKDFNAGIWNELEERARYWAIKYDGLYVVTGGVLNDDLKRIGKEKVAVPKYFYKILLNKNNGNFKMIGFLIPNEYSDLPLYKYVVSVDEIENKTGIDFSPN